MDYLGFYSRFFFTGFNGFDGMYWSIVTSRRVASPIGWLARPAIDHCCLNSDSFQSVLHLFHSSWIGNGVPRFTVGHSRTSSADSPAGIHTIICSLATEFIDYCECDGNRLNSIYWAEEMGRRMRSRRCRRRRRVAWQPPPFRGDSLSGVLRYHLLRGYAELCGILRRMPDIPFRSEAQDFKAIERIDLMRNRP